MDCLRRLFEISERERNHELLLSMKNLQELGANPFSHIVSVLPCHFPSEVVKGKHFVLANLLKSLLGGSSQAEAASKPLVWSDHLPLTVHDLKPIP